MLTTLPSLGVYVLAVLTAITANALPTIHTANTALPNAATTNTASNTIKELNQLNTIP